MKNLIYVTSVLVLFASQVLAQGKNQITGPSLGDLAPKFIAESTTGTINFPKDYTNTWKILFSHPADFTPVCTSEILELAAEQKEFDNLNTKVIVVSVDSLQTHFQWEKSMESLRYKGKDPVKIEFPLVADTNLSISRAYGMIQKSTSSTRAVRGVFIIDPKNRIRAIFYYPMEIGRNLNEIQRTLLALQTADAEHVVIPANWKQGDDVLVPYGKPVVAEGNITLDEDPDYYQLTWYMRYKKGTK